MKKYMASSFILLLTLTATLTSLGCGGFSQDPLKGKDSSFRDGLSDVPDPGQSKPYPDSIQFDVPDLATFKENESGSVRLGARIFVEGYTLQVEIANPDLFPSATYDQVSGTFNWTPPVGTVNPSRPVLVLPLKVRAIASKPGAEAFVEEKDVPIYVTGAVIRPIILRMERVNNWSFIREGTMQEFTVVVEDKAALVDESTWPKLSTLDSPLGAFVRTQSVESLGNHLFQFEMRLDLSSTELTSDITEQIMKLVASSWQQAVSPGYETTVAVHTSFSAPVTSWNQSIKARSGVKLVEEFVILDPKQEANLEIFELDNESGATVTCEPDDNQFWMLRCKLEWDGPIAGEYAIYMRMRSVNTKNEEDYKIHDRSLRFYFEVSEVHTLVGGNL